MIPEPIRRFADHFCCPCVIDDGSMTDDGHFICYPRKIGNSFLFYGRRKSYFPFHCMVGPDWLMVVLVYFLIISINAVVLYVVSPLGWPPVLIGGIGAFILLLAYSAVAFTDPGTIYKNDFSSIIEEHHQHPDLEQQQPLHSNLHLHSLPSQDQITVTTNNPPSSPTPARTIPTRNASTRNGRSGPTMECGQCQFQRPMSARHCVYCKTCIDELDHHCPW